MEYLTPGLVDFLDRMGTITVLILVALGVITEKLVWHKRYARAVERADRWERIALDALMTGAQAGVKAAEVAVGVVSALPDPEQARERTERADNP
jgi:hypothetical protein